MKGVCRGDPAESTVKYLSIAISQKKKKKIDSLTPLPLLHSKPALSLPILNILILRISDHTYGTCWLTFGA